MTRREWITVFGWTFLGMVALSVVYILVWKVFPPFADRQRIFTGIILLITPVSVDALVKIREKDIGMLAMKMIEKKLLIWVKLFCYALAIGFAISQIDNEVLNFSLWFMVVWFFFETSRRLETIPKLGSKKMLDIR